MTYVTKRVTATRLFAMKVSITTWSMIAGLRPKMALSLGFRAGVSRMRLGLVSTCLGTGLGGGIKWNTASVVPEHVN